MGKEIDKCDVSGTPRLISPQQIIHGLRRNDVDEKIEDFAVGSIGYMSSNEIHDLMQKNNWSTNVAVIQLEAGSSAIRASVLLGDFMRRYCFVFDPEDVNHVTMHYVQ